jgi:hypothetical protein
LHRPALTPRWRTTTRQRDEKRLLLTIEFATAPTTPVFAERRRQALLNETPAGAMDRRDADAQSVGNLFVGRVFRRLEENMGTPHLPC